MSDEKPASDKRLGLIHNLTAEWALSLLDGTATEEVIDAQGEIKLRKVRPSAAEMAIVRAFLKDNNITCAPSDDNALGRLQQKLAEKQGRRAPPVLPRLTSPLDEHTEGPLDGTGIH